MTLTERVILYADGDKENGIPPHSFDFSHEDMETIMSALRLAYLVSRQEHIHNFQLERFDIRDFCVCCNGYIGIAKNILKKHPYKAIFRLDESGINVGGKSDDDPSHPFADDVMMGDVTE